MKETIQAFEKDFEKELIQAMKSLLESVKGDIANLRTDNPLIPLIANVAAIYSGVAHLEHNYHEDHGNWKDDVSEELNSAAEKYSQFLSTNDPSLLEYARDELKHGNWYLGRMKMSTDEHERQKAAEYQKKYDELVMKINAPHGTEPLPKL